MAANKNNNNNNNNLQCIEQREQQQQQQRELDNIYTNPSSPACFEGVEAVYCEAKSHALNVTRKPVEWYLRKQRAYTRHGAIRTWFPRNPIWSYCVNDCWFADLHDITKLSWQNRQKNFLLIVVDSLSQFLYCVPLKNKSADVVLDGIKNVVEWAGTSPGRLTVDAGSEFVNYKLRQYMEREGMRLQIARAPLKASLAELMGKLLKNKIYRYMMQNRTRKYIDCLQEFVDSLNSRPLKSLGGRRPKDITYDNQMEVYEAQLGRYRGRRNADFRFEIGDEVRIVYKMAQSGAFTKGYFPSFTKEIYRIRSRVPSYPSPLYKLSDALGNPILGRYYSQELRKTTATDPPR